MVPGAAGIVLSNVGVDEPGAAGLEVDKGVADVCFSFAKGFDLGAVKDHASLEPLQQVVVVGGGAVLGDDLILFLLFRFFGLLGWLGHSLILRDTEVKC